MARDFAARRTLAIALGTTLAMAAVVGTTAALGSDGGPAAKRTAQASQTVRVDGYDTNIGPTPQEPIRAATATSTCPKGTKLAFGGYTGDVTFTGNAAGVTLSGLRRASKRDWSASAFNLAEGAGNATSIAYCAKVKRLTEVTGSVNIPPLGRGTATATCPRKTSVRSGGLSAQDSLTSAEPLVVPTGMRRASKRTLQVEGVNLGETNAGTLEAIAYCGKGKKLTEKFATATVANRQQGSATATCPKRKPVAFGGFDVEADVADLNPLTVLSGLVRPSKRTWTASAGAAIGPGEVTSYAYCAKKKK
jgi:hypothetical protein